MFWVVTTSTAFCTISLADIIRCVAIDQTQYQWNFWKTAHALARFPSPEKPSVSIEKQLKNIWFLPRRLVDRDASIRVIDFIQTFFCPGRTRRERISYDASETERGTDISVTQGRNNNGECYTRGTNKSGTQGRKISDECYTNTISSLSPREIRLFAFETFYDMQFSPDGEWVVFCAAIHCHAIHVGSEVSLASNGEINGTTK